jgi:hypothetical protein
MDRNFLFTISFRALPLLSPIQWIPGPRRPMGGAHHSPLFNAEVKNACVLISTSLIRLHGEERWHNDILTFFIQLWIAMRIWNIFCRNIHFHYLSVWRCNKPFQIGSLPFFQNFSGLKNTECKSVQPTSNNRETARLVTESSVKKVNV